MNFNEILRSFPDDLNKIYRKKETISKKLINGKWSVFLITHVSKKIYIYIYNPKTSN